MKQMYILFCLTCVCWVMSLTLAGSITDSSVDPSLKERMKYNIWQKLAQAANVTNFCLAQGLAASDMLSSCLHPVCHSPSELNRTPETAQKGAYKPQIWHQILKTWGNFTKEIPAGALALKTPHIAGLNAICVRMNECRDNCLTPEGKALNCTHIEDLPSTPKHMTLPTGWFLSCNQVTYNYIPGSLAHGTTCCLSRLALVLPEKHTLTHTEPKTPRHKRAFELRTLTGDCDSNVRLLSHPEILSLAFSILGVPALAASNAKIIGKLACLAVKNINHTSKALSLLNQEQSILRQSMLENRAAIDFLLMKDHLGCEVVKNVCCFNVTDNSKAINTQIKSLNEAVNDIKQRSGTFIDQIWNTLTGWMPTADWVKHLFVWTIAALSTLISFCCLIYCLPGCASALRPKPRASVLPVVQQPSNSFPLLTLEERMWGANFH